MTLAERLHAGFTKFPVYKQLHGKHYRIDLASTDTQKQQAFTLRFQIFNEELGQGLAASNETGLDQDAHDVYSDHLLVWDTDDNVLVGTYRVLPLARVQDSIGLYSETEFNLTALRAAKLNLVEVGRACIHQNYRTGAVINLLWHGLACYMQQHHLEYLCGCASLHSNQDKAFAEQVYHYCEQHHKLTPNYLRTEPHPENRLANFTHLSEDVNTALVKRNLPPLVRGYFSIGCKIGGEPAYDPEFGVIDFFILLEFAQLAKGASRFLG